TSGEEEEDETAASAARPAMVQTPAARLVRAAWPGPPLAPDARPLPRARVGNHAAADAGRSRAAEVRRVAGSVSDVRSARRRRGTGCRPDVVSAWLQHQAAEVAGDRPGVGRAIQR